MCNIDTIGAGWVAEEAESLTCEIVQMSPVEYNQGHRYLPQSVSRFSGYINFDRTPYWIEPIEMMDVRSPCREGAIKKAVQVAYSTAMESVIFYFAGHIRTIPLMYANATVDLARARIEHNFIPMFRQSGMDIFQSADTGNSRKTGLTKDHMQWIGGGYLVPKGAQDSKHMRDVSVLGLLMDEVDAWPDVVDGDTMQLFRDRTSGFHEDRKIFIGSTPGIAGASNIQEAYERGDQRVYKVRCLKCGYPQVMRWRGTNKQTSKEYGIFWDLADNGTLDIESVRYHCKNCHEAHMEHHKVKMITKENCFWEATAAPVEPNIMSWHIPAMISRIYPWYKCVSAYRASIDDKTGRTKSVSKLQVFYNNVLGEPFEQRGGRVRFTSVSAHRRMFYRKGEIPNREIEQHCVTGVLFLTMTVDVHKAHLNVAIWGWTAGDGFGFNPWLIDYFQILDDSEVGFESIDAPGWGELADVIDNRSWVSDDGKEYRLIVSLVDSGYAESVVVDFCRQWSNGVWPIKGNTQTLTDKSIKSFKASKTNTGELLYVITVNHYKDRIAPVLRQTWRPEEGIQRPYTFNAPVDTTDDELKELTREYKIEKKFPNGRKVYEWHRPNGADNELWDLIVYGHASVEILAWIILVHEHQMETVDLGQFWEYCKTGSFYDSL